MTVARLRTLARNLRPPRLSTIVIVAGLALLLHPPLGAVALTLAILALAEAWGRTTQRS